MKLTGRVVVITGAASGIGRALAVALARKRAHLALADRNFAGLEETRALLGKNSGTVTLHELDVSDEAAVNHFAVDVVGKHGKIDVLINNAGVALFGTIAELTTDEMKWLFEINFWGTVYGTRAFLPTLMVQPQACIVNISSIFGIYAPPGQSAYAASKFAVRGFSESAEIIRGIRKKKNRVIIGADAKKIDLAARLFPETITKRIGRNAQAKALQ